MTIQRANRMLRREMLGGILGGLLAGTIAAPALADQLPMTPQTGVSIDDFMYFSIGGAMQVQELPRFSWGNDLSTGRAAFEKSAHVAMGGVAAVFGYTLNDFGFGTKPRFEIATIFTIGQARARQRLPTSTDGQLVASPLDPTQPSLGYFASADRDLAYRVLNESGDLALRFKTDFNLGTRWTVTPGIALIGGAGQQRHYMSIHETNINGPFNTYLKESLTTWRLGGEVSTDFTFKLNDSIRLHAGVTGALFHQQTGFKGDECLPDGPGTIECDPIISKVGASRNKLGYRVGTSLGATWSWGWGYFTAMAVATYNGNMPGVDNPQYGATPKQQARVGYENTWSVGSLLMLTFPLQ